MGCDLSKQEVSVCWKNPTIYVEPLLASKNLCDLADASKYPPGLSKSKASVKSEKRKEKRSPRKNKKPQAKKISLNLMLDAESKSLKGMIVWKM